MELIRQMAGTGQSPSPDTARLQFSRDPKLYHFRDRGVQVFDSEGIELAFGGGQRKPFVMEIVAECVVKIAVDIASDTGTTIANDGDSTTSGFDTVFTGILAVGVVRNDGALEQSGEFVGDFTSFGVVGGFGVNSVCHDCVSIRYLHHTARTPMPD